MSTMLEQRGNGEQNQNFLQDKVKPKRTVSSWPVAEPFDGIYIRLLASSDVNKNNKKIH
jgi:hypothetical protein